MVYTLGVYSRLLPFQKESTSGTGHPDQRLPSSPSHCFSPIPCLPRHPCFSIFTAPAGPCLGTDRGHLSAYQPAASVPSNMPSPLLPDWAHVFLSCFSGFLGLPLLYTGPFIIWPLAAFPGPSSGPICTDPIVKLNWSGHSCHTTTLSQTWLFFIPPGSPFCLS